MGRLEGRRGFERPQEVDPLRGRQELDRGIGILSLFVKAGLAGSNGEARRHVQGGAVRLNDRPVSDERSIVGSADLSADGLIKLSLGKKKHVLVRAD